MRHRYEVRVEQDDALGEYHNYVIDADSPVDAEQIAFALDGGVEIGARRDATGLSGLAGRYCDIMSSKPIGGAS